MGLAARAEDSSRPARVWTGARRVDSASEVAQALAAVGKIAGRRAVTAGMTRAVSRAEEVRLSGPDVSRSLPVVPELAALLPWGGGLRRGATMAAAGSTSLLLTLLAEPMESGSFAAVVGKPEMGAVAASEYGLDLARLALVPNPGPEWPTVIAALIDGVDLVVVAPPTEVSAGVARSLMARARQRGTVLVSTRAWPGCDLTVRMVNRRWLGLGQGRGRLRLQKVTLASNGRGRAERGRQVSMTLPPATLVERVGRLPGQIPGIPMDRLVDPDRAQVGLGRQPLQATPAPVTDLWAPLLTGGPRG